MDLWRANIIGFLAHQSLSVPFILRNISITDYSSPRSGRNAWGGRSFLMVNDGRKRKRKDILYNTINNQKEKLYKTTKK